MHDSIFLFFKPNDKLFYEGMKEMSHKNLKLILGC